MMPENPFTVDASRIISMRDFVVRTFGEAEGGAIFNTQAEEFRGKFVYVFEVGDGNNKWEINRRLWDFKDLHKRLSSNREYKSVAAFGVESDQPREELLRRLEHFLRHCLAQGGIKAEVMDFLEISGHDYQGVQKYKEVFMLKKPGGRYTDLCASCTSLFGFWKNMLFIIHNQGIIYKDSKGSNREYITYDYDFKITYGKGPTGLNLGIIIKSTQRELRLKANSLFEFVEFIYYVKLGIDNSEYVSINRYGSFAPVRTNCHVDFLIDGEEYYSSLAKHLLAATRDVYITGWWVSPEFHLIRPITKETEQFRFDRIIKTIAEKGVTVRILVYNESKSVLNIDSQYTKSALESLSSNVKVIRHPVGMLQLLWSHHEKQVIIDEEIGFLGGLDICYGRYDTREHRLFDNEDMYPGIDYNNIRRVDICRVKDHDICGYDRTKPMLPWHDLGLKAQGPIVWDMSRHFIQYWNYASFQSQQNEREIIAAQHNVIKKQFEKIERGIERGIEKVKDYTTALKNRIFKKDEIQGVYPQMIGSTLPFDNYINHIKDSSETENFNPPDLYQAQSSVAMKEPNYSNYLHVPKDSITTKQAQSINLNININKEYGDILENLRETRNKDALEEIDEPIQQNKPLVRGYSFKNSIAVSGRQPQKSRVRDWTCECQMVRSAGAWSIGCSPTSTEPSIQVAYIELISNAKHYIYIENQFFISSYANPSVVKNEIVHAMALRILKAYQNNQTFRVYVMLPLLPGFAGEVYDPSAKVLRLQMHWQYLTISRSKTSLFSQLSAYIPDPSRYIRFMGARTHSRLRDTGYPETEIVYVHSKLMIVDDQFVIMGSANINDRSMRGKRDSELCMVIKDNDMIPSVIQGEPVMVSRKVQNFRKRLFEEHFGLSSDQETDPASDYTWNLIGVIMRENTEFYRKVFACYPDDAVHTFSDLNQFIAKPQPQLYDQLKESVKGQAVEFPLNFLINQSLFLKKTEKESLLPLEFAT